MLGAYRPGPGTPLSPVRGREKQYNIINEYIALHNTNRVSEYQGAEGPRGMWCWGRSELATRTRHAIVACAAAGAAGAAGIP